MRKKENLQWTCSWFKFRNKTRWTNDSRQSYEPETAVLGYPTFPVSLWVIPSLRGTTSRDSCLQPATRNSLGQQDTFLKIFLHRVTLQQLSLEFKLFWISTMRACVSENWETCRPSERIGKKHWEFCNTYTEVLNLESSLSCKRNLSAELHVWTDEESSLGNAFQ